VTPENVDRAGAAHASAEVEAIKIAAEAFGQDAERLMAVRRG
jgi:hypothetical protein